jgi:uncharacterized protein with PIN domain
VKAGETERFDCEECSAEFEVTYEPKCKDKPSAAKGILNNDVTTCPFCGAGLPDPEEDEDEGDDEE